MYIFVLDYAEAKNPFVKIVIDDMHVCERDKSVSVEIITFVTIL